MFDYIIIGAGSAGCVLANRLSQDPDTRVLLLEAGSRDWHPFIHMPAGLAKLVNRKGVNWNYDTAPEPHLHNRTLWWPRGKVLGGSSSINAMCYIRGVPGDYDDWAKQAHRLGLETRCCPTSSAPRATARGGDALHGGEGPLGRVATCATAIRSSHAFIDAGNQAGIASQRTISTDPCRPASACTRSPSAMARVAPAPPPTSRRSVRGPT